MNLVELDDRLSWRFSTLAQAKFATLYTDPIKPLISGVHAIIFSRDAEADRAFFRDVLGLDSVDSGGGWLIFALPPAELGIHPTEEDDGHQLFLLCEDIEATAKELERKKVPLRRPFDEADWGRVTEITLPGGGRIGLYQPKHPLAHQR